MISSDDYSKSSDDKHGLVGHTLPDEHGSDSKPIAYIKCISELSNNATEGNSLELSSDVLSDVNSDLFTEDSVPISSQNLVWDAPSNNSSESHPSSFRFKMPSFRNYVGVQFMNNTCTVVPNHWVQTFNGSLHCKWPPADDDVDALSENNTPVEENWTTSQVKKILVQSSTFRGAELKLYTCRDYKTEAVTPDASVSSSVVLSAASTQADEVKDSTALQEISNKIDALIDISLSNRRDIEEILAILESQQPSATYAFDVATFQPATSKEELDKIVTNQMVMTELQRCVGVRLRDTVRRMLQRLMTPDLAKEMSYSGLGHARQRTKISFKEHPTCQLILDALAAVGHNEDQKQKASAIQEVLRHCKEWSGSKKHRVQSEKLPTSSLIVESRSH
ncbi:hypothetical protein FHG87_009072 [Trinorchestia longiramus]|nr:hypothetical protein FHG87_009072 [Trinorchestia longiramus]